MDDFFEQLKSNLRGPLPGRAVQYQMAPASRRVYREAPATARDASVMALFYPKNEDLHIVLIERVNDNPNDRHGGQISFPGGKVDASDPSPREAALREAEEEIGVRGSDIRLLGSLTEVYIPVSNFVVHPFVGHVPYDPDFVPQTTEVKSILEVPFQRLLDTGSKKTKDIRVSTNIILQEVPYFDIQEKIVWGATAMILNELIALSGSAFHTIAKTRWV